MGEGDAASDRGLDVGPAMCGALGMPRGNPIALGAPKLGSLEERSGASAMPLAYRKVALAAGAGLAGGASVGRSFA